MSNLALFSLLETHVLPGFPPVDAPGALDILPLVLGWPVAIGAVFALIILGPHWSRQARSKDVERA